MSSKSKIWSYTLAAIGAFLGIFYLWASEATATRHPVTASSLGHSSDMGTLKRSLNVKTEVQLKTVETADWAVPLSGLLNLNHPKAVAAGLSDRSEPIKVYAYHLVHPTFGDYLIDTGVSKSFADSPQSEGVPGWLVSQMGLESLSLQHSSDQLIKNIGRPLQGVFLTHLHMDHISGLPAVKNNVPLYVGPGEATTPYILNAATRGAVDALLQERPALQEWNAPVVDVFGDKSVFALHVPGHTAGSTAFLVNSIDGPILITGDACHTAWGWQHRVEPGTFSNNLKRSQESLGNLLQLAEEYPEIQVKLGHQEH